METRTQSTDLFERYMQAIRKHLPAEGQDDIIAELRANLDAQREEREAALGRPITEGEMIDWLKELGPPMQVATRYQPPRYLIGPAVFPLYWQILRLAVLWSSVAYAFSIGIRLIVESHRASWVAGLLFAFPGFFISVVAWVTAVFVIFEFISRRYPEKCPDFLRVAPHWSPTSLPPLDKPLPAGAKPRAFSTAIAEIVVQFAVLIWLLLLPSYPFLLLGPGAVYLAHSPVRLAPVVFSAFWAIVAFNAVQLVWQAYNLFTDNWRIRSKVHQLVTKGLGLVPLLILLFAPGHSLVQPNPFGIAHLPAGVDIDFAAINRYVFLSVVVLICIGAVQLAADLWKLSPAAARWRARLVL